MNDLLGPPGAAPGGGVIADDVVILTEVEIPTVTEPGGLEPGRTARGTSGPSRTGRIDYTVRTGRAGAIPRTPR